MAAHAMIMLEPLARASTVDGEDFQPMTVSLGFGKGQTPGLRIGLREGKNREIPRARTRIRGALIVAISYSAPAMVRSSWAELNRVIRRALERTGCRPSTPLRAS